MANHLLDEVEKVCTHVAILKQGNLLVEQRMCFRRNDIITAYGNGVKKYCVK
jgi:ABC-2 type transport system ATP-binding protein